LGCGNSWSKTPITGSGIYHAWQAWQALAGIGPYKFHELRHSHVTHSLDNGIPVHHVSRQAGHSSPDITLRILHLQQGSLIQPTLPRL
jgi:integrase